MLRQIWRTPEVIPGSNEATPAEIIRRIGETRWAVIAEKRLDDIRAARALQRLRGYEVSASDHNSYPLTLTATDDIVPGWRLSGRALHEGQHYRLDDAHQAFISLLYRRVIH
jgi:hypothetical protein